MIPGVPAVKGAASQKHAASPRIPGKDSIGADP